MCHQISTNLRSSLDANYKQLPMPATEKLSATNWHGLAKAYGEWNT